MSEQVTRATFTPQTGNKTPIEVHFNPVSLQVLINNTLEDKGKGKDKKQYISKTAATLAMDLIFDTTHKGSDVRLATQKIARFMEPGKEPGEQKIPTIVLFEWGTFKFQGLIQSYRETIEFFSSDGVPLRASISLTMARQEEVFEPSPEPPRDSSVQVSAGISATAVASIGGAPDAGRTIAAANNQDSLRFSSGAFTLDASIKLSPPIAFATGGVGISGGIGVGGGVGISSGIGVSGGIGISGGAGISIGGSASAGITASEGAFAGLRVSSNLRPITKIDTNPFIQASDSVGFATSRNASFQVGGQADIEGSASLSTNVRSRSKIQFEED